MARGPAYPYIDLEEAIGMVRKVYDYARRSSAPMDALVKDAWKYSPTSSSAGKVLAALKYFELIEEESADKGKSIKITDRAYRILVDSAASAERKQAIKDAALSPKWYQFCWTKWGAEMPPAMRSNLIFEHHFIETTVDTFLKDYKKTIEFAGLLSDAKSNSAKDKGNGVLESSDVHKIGDYVQWESQGVLRLPTAAKLVRFSDDRTHAFIEGSLTGIPVEQLIPGEKPLGAEQLFQPPPKADPPIKEAPGMRQDVFSLMEGNVTIQWPSVLSVESLEEIKDWLKLLERRISRSVEKPIAGNESGTNKKE